MSLIKLFNGKKNVTGRQIKKYREEKQISYERLSAKLELMGISIHKQSLYDIERNKRTVKDYELYAIAKVLNKNVNDLLTEIEEELKEEN